MFVVVCAGPCFRHLKDNRQDSCPMMKTDNKPANKYIHTFWCATNVSYFFVSFQCCGGGGGFSMCIRGFKWNQDHIFWPYLCAV